MFNKSFLKWWLIFTIIVVIFGTMGHLGWWSYLWINDFTKISFIIVGLFSILTCYCGYLSSADQPTNEFMWFSADSMFTLGLIGTIFGMIYTISSLHGIDVGQLGESKDLIIDMLLGMGTAFTTTVVGMACSQLLKLQLLVIEEE